MFPVLCESIKFHQLQRILREMPWLWGIKQKWTSKDEIRIKQVDDRSDFLDYWICGDPSPGAKGVCYVHALGDDGEQAVNQVVRLEVEGYGRNLFDTLLELHKSGFLFAMIQHVAVEMPDGWIAVYRPSRKTSIEELFLAKCARMPTSKVC